MGEHDHVRNAARHDTLRAGADDGWVSRVEGERLDLGAVADAEISRHPLQRVLVTRREHEAVALSGVHRREALGQSGGGADDEDRARHVR